MKLFPVEETVICRVSVGVLLAAAALPGPGPARAQAASGTATYQVFASPQGSTTLCPGEQLQIWVGVNQLITRTGAAGSVPVGQPMPYSLVNGSVANQSIGTLRPPLIVIGATQNSRGSFMGVATFTALSPGQTTINFTGTVIPNIRIPIASGGGSVDASPAAPVTVTVACNYSISLYSVWRLPGERILDVLGVVPSAKLIPNSAGRFSTIASMSSSAAWMGSCPGASKIQRSQVTIFGELGGGFGLGRMASLKVKVQYAPVSSTTREGCIGKSKTGRGQPEPLDLYLDPNGGVQSASHVLKTYVPAAGNTTIVLKRIP